MLRKLIPCIFFLMSFSSVHAGEANSPEDALKIVANKIEAGDLDGVLRYFSPNEKYLKTLRLITSRPQADRQHISKMFREAKLKTSSDMKVIGYEGARRGDQYHVYNTALMNADGNAVESEISVCGNTTDNDWYVCNW